LVKVANRLALSVETAIPESSWLYQECPRSAERPHCLAGLVATVLAQYFEQAFRQSIELFRGKLSERLAVHQERAGALINLVRQTSADLMEISVILPQSEQAFEARREPYWTAPEPSVSLLDMSAGSLARFMPSGIRKKRARDQLAADTDRAVLRNLANLDWAIRQNLEDAFRRFESSLAEQLGRALGATRQAMQIAIERKTARTEEVDAYVKESTRTIALLSDLLTALEGLDSNSNSQM
jgi:hypothetical protein